MADGDGVSLANMIANLMSGAGDNLRAKGQSTSNAANQAMDRLSMSNPNKQGPRLPDVATPDEASVYNDSLGAAQGSLGVVSKLHGPSPMASYLDRAIGLSKAPEEGLSALKGTKVLLGSKQQPHVITQVMENADPSKTKVMLSDGENSGISSLQGLVNRGNPIE